MPSRATQVRHAIQHFKVNDGKVDDAELNAVLALAKGKRGALLKSTLAPLTDLHNSGASSFDKSDTRGRLFVALVDRGVDTRELGVGSGNASSDLAAFDRASNRKKMDALYPSADGGGRMNFFDYLDASPASDVATLSLSRHELVSGLPRGVKTRASDATKTITEQGEFGPWDVDPTITQLMKNGEIYGYAVEYDLSGPGYQAASTVVYDREFEKIGNMSYVD